MARLKRLRWVIGLAMLMLVSVVGISAVGHAQRFTTETDDTDTVNSSLYSAGKAISIKGQVYGDIFCAGQTVDIDATVHGDVICAGQDVTIAGKVDGDVRVVGQTVSISAAVDTSVTALASDFSLDAPATVGRDLTAIGETLHLKGGIGRDAMLNGTQAIVASKVGRDVRFEGSRLTVQRTTIGGQLTIISQNKASISSDATIGGGQKQLQPHKQSRFSMSTGTYALILIALVTLSVVCALVAPHAIHVVGGTIGKNWAKPMLVGLVASFALPLLAIMLCITVIGIPVAMLVLVLWIGLMLLSGPVAGYYLGSRILPKQPNVLVRTAVGSVVLVALYVIPFIGFFLMLVGYWIGSGAVLVALKRRLGKPNYMVTAK